MFQKNLFACLLCMMLTLYVFRDIHLKYRDLSHDMTKPTKWHVRPANTRISLGICPVWSESSLSAWRNLGSLATHWVHSEDWSDWADAQADLNLRWAHTHFVGFVMSYLIWWLHHSWLISHSVFELPHDKTNKMTVRPANLGICPVWSKSSLCAQWVAKDSSFLHADSEDWSDWANAQADMSLCWAHMQFCWFCHEVAHFCI